MLDFLTNLFRREETSRSAAKERLRLVLMSDRVALAPETFDLMKGEMLSVLQRYLDVDEHGIDVHFENAERRFMLYANIPVTNIKTSEQIESERHRYAVGGNGNGLHAGQGTGTRRRRRRRRNRTTATGDMTPPAPAVEPYSQASNGASHPETDAGEPNGSL